MNDGKDVSVARWMAECRPWDGDEPVRAEALAQGALGSLRCDYNAWAWRECGHDQAAFMDRDGRTTAAFRAAWNGAVLALDLAREGET